VGMGYYGEKKTPVFGQNYLEVQDNIPATKLVVKTVTEVGIDFSHSSEADIKLNLNVAGIFKGSADAAVDALRSDTLKLMKLDMDLNDVKSAVNGSPGVLNNLASYGNDARVSHQIFVVMSATEANSFKAGGTISFTKLGQTLEAKGGTNGSTTVEFSPG